MKKFLYKKAQDKKYLPLQLTRHQTMCEREKLAKKRLEELQPPDVLMHETNPIQCNALLLNAYLEHFP